MNWGGFPVAFRFPVKDFSAETRRRCWSYVLPALTYADLSNGTRLLEAESVEPFDPERLVYLAIVAPTVIPPSRKNSLLWRKDGRLMSALALYQPVAQENYLELFTQDHMLVEIAPDRTVVAQEDAEGLFPDRIEVKDKKPSCVRALILPKGELPFEARLNLCRRTIRELYEADDSLYLKMLPLSPGGEGAVYTSAAFRHGRLFTEMIPDTSGEKHRCLFGVLPGRKLLIDGFSVPDIAAPLDEAYGLGRAIRVAKDRGFTDVSLCAAGLNPPTSNAAALDDLNELYDLSGELSLYDKVILTECSKDDKIKTESIDIDRRDKGCVSSILSRRKGTAAN